MNIFHTSVLLEETIDLLNIQQGKKYIDATLGGGGHTGAVLERGGIVLGIDADQEAVDYVKENFKFQISNFKLKLARANFKDIDTIAREHGFDRIAGVLFDLGVSSHQLESAERGFSFAKEGPLDMRMDHALTVRAADLINILTKGELNELFNKFGEERFAHAITSNIIRARRIKPIKTTKELADIVSQAAPAYQAGIHPATRVFQALRIAVNDELNNLREALPKAIQLLEQHGRIAVISFHSLEDRVVKKQFTEWEELGIGRVITEKPVTPALVEKEKNKRSRSAKLRVFKKN